MYPQKEFNSLWFLCFFFGIFISETHSEKDITINIGPGTEECFYESMKAGQVIDIDYQVIDGGQGSFDISFYLMSPFGRALVMDLKKPGKSHRIEVDEKGDYKLCFDNRYSNFYQKTVYFELIIENEDGTDADMWEFSSSSLSPDEHYEVTIKDIEDSVKRVKSHIMKIRHLQEIVRAFAAKDRNILEAKSLRVNVWSFIQIIVMIGVGFIQVVMVKSLFDEKSRLQKFWKNTPG